MRSFLSLLALLLSSSSSGLAFETCEECRDHIVAFGGLVNDHKEDITVFLKENYCPETNDPNCDNHVDELYPDMLSMVVDEFIILSSGQICTQVGACNPPFLRELTCDDCRRNMDRVRELLTGRDHITEMEHWLERHYCTPDIPHCPGFLRDHFPQCHRLVMDEFMRPERVCQIWGYC